MRKCCNTRMSCIDSRSRNGYTRRRYECPKCGSRISSVEIFAERFEELKDLVTNKRYFVRMNADTMDIEQIMETLGITRKYALKLAHLEGVVIKGTKNRKPRTAKQEIEDRVLPDPFGKPRSVRVD